MPSLKQLTCSVEWASTDTPFQEFGTMYGDGVVETFILVPKQPQPFTVHLVSRGFIAEGLAMMVFIDGEYQCNRNRLNLRPATKGVPKKLTEVDFRLRQKEKAIGDGTYLGREWRFDAHNIAFQPATNQAIDHFDRLGDIEIFVLRCKARNPFDQEREESDSGADSRVPDVSLAEDEEEEQGGQDDDRVVQPAAEDDGQMGGFGAGLFDGAGDGENRPHHFGLDGAGYLYGVPCGYHPIHLYEGWPPQYAPVQSWPGPIDYQHYPQSNLPASALPLRPPPPPPSHPGAAQEKRVHFDFGQASGPPYTPQPPGNAGWQRTAAWTSQQPVQPVQPTPPTQPMPPIPPMQPMQPVQPVQPMQAPPAHFQHLPTAPYPAVPMPYMTPPAYSISAQPPWASRAPHQGWPHVPDPYGPAQAPLGFVPNTTCYHTPGSFQGSAFNPDPPPSAQEWNGNPASNASTPHGLDPAKESNNAASQGSEWKADAWKNTDDDGFTSGNSNTNDNDQWNDNAIQHEVNDGDKETTNSADAGWSNGNNDTKVEASGAWDGKEKGAVQREQEQAGGDGGGGAQNIQNNAWEQTGSQDGPTQSSGNGGLGDAPTARKQQPSPAPQPPHPGSQTLPVMIPDPLAIHPRSLYGPYGPYVELKTSAASEAPAEVEEEPRYDVPISFVQRKGSSHQVVAGRGYKYLHRRCTPCYIDSIEEPYARFVFKYRTRDQLQADLGISIDAEPSVDAEVQTLQAMEKQQIIDMLLRAQRALGGKIPSPPPPPPAQLLENDRPALMQTVPVPRPVQSLPDYRLPAPRIGSNPAGPATPGYNLPPPQYQGPPPNNINWASGGRDGPSPSQPPTHDAAPAFGAWASGGQPPPQVKQEGARAQGDSHGGDPASSSAGSSPLGVRQGPVGTGWEAVAPGSGGGRAEAAPPNGGW